ncbi:hypothetical protein C0583_02270 [Candidatus Parcubacteria bacterium]|nr:MAG: hypothetical protein C0583_02270 [Candidatus Parcubacteria bacterium]
MEKNFIVIDVEDDGIVINYKKCSSKDDLLNHFIVYSDEDLKLIISFFVENLHYLPIFASEVLDEIDKKFLPKNENEINSVVDVCLESNQFDSTDGTSIGHTPSEPKKIIHTYERIGIEKGKIVLDGRSFNSTKEYENFLETMDKNEKEAIKKGLKNFEKGIQLLLDDLQDSIDELDSYKH